MLRFLKDLLPQSINELVCDLIGWGFVLAVLIMRLTDVL